MQDLVIDPAVSAIAFGVAMRLQTLIDKAAREGSVNTAEVAAALQPEVNRLMLIANNNPL